MMNKVKVEIPLVDIINAIVALEKNEQHKEAILIVKNIVYSYSGNYDLLESDIDDVFLDAKKRNYSENKREISERWPEDYKILKKLFGGLLWSD